MKMEQTNDIILSFIIPVYNVEQYLNECIDSILNQINDECEIILVDDGSTDLSGKICDEYSEKYKHIDVVHKKNSGPSDARNIGISMAKGKYIAFVDSDDRVADGCIEEIIKWCNESQVDVCFMQAIKFYPDGSMEDMADEIERQYVDKKEKLEVLEYLSTRPKFPGSACTKLFRTEFLKSISIFFPQNVGYAEDLYFVRDSILEAKCYDVLDSKYYQYRQNRVESRTSSASSNLFEGIERFINDSVKKLAVDNTPTDRISQYALSWVAYEFSIMLLHFSYMNKEDKRFYYKKLKKHSWVLKFAKNKKTKMIHVLCVFLGLKITAFIIGQYFRFLKGA